jgi:hypothetical protein
MYYDQSKKRFYLLLVLSLCMHSLLMVVIFVIKYPENLLLQIAKQQPIQLPTPAAVPVPTQQSQQQPQQPQPLMQEKEDSLAVPFRLNLTEDSQSGATVIFQDIPELAGEGGQFDGDIQPTTLAIQKEDDQISEQSDIAQEQQEKETQTQELTNPDRREIIDLPLGTTHPEEQPIKKKKKKRKKKIGTGLRNASPVTSKLNLAQFAEGFINYSKHRLKDTIDFRSKDLKYSSYLTKMSWYIQNSLNINNKPLNAPFNINTHVTIDFEVNENGTLASCTISSSGLSKIDAFLSKVMNDAGPFPPLPKHFNTKLFKTRLGMNLSFVEGTHLYGWYFH